MKQKIHELFNDITIDLQEYTEEVVDEVTEERWIRNAKKSVRKRRRKNVLKPVAATVLLVIGVGYTLPVYAMTNPLLYKIADFMGMNRSLDKYSNTINKTVEQKGITVQLGEVLLDNDEIIVTTRITSKEPLMKDISLEKGEVYVNGKNVGKLYDGWDRKLDEYTWEVAMSIKGIEELEGDVGIKIILSEFCIDGEKVVKGNWKFEFTANGDELMGETIEIPVEEKIILSGGEEIIVERYTANTVSQKIYFRKVDPIYNAQLEFDLSDERGNKFKLQSSTIDLIGGVFKWEGLENKSSKRSLILHLRVAKIGEAYEKINDEIKIELSKEDN